MPDMVSKLSGTTKNLTAGLISDPQKIENIISMVRTVTPLTSPQTVSKVNTYLPLFEKVSTLLGMYSFLNRAQTFRPIESLNAKSPADMMTALMKGGNFPVGKILAQPLIAGNMEKMMGAVAMNMMKNGNFNDILKNGNINDMLSSFAKSSGKGTSDVNGNIDLNSLMETFMPVINSMTQNTSKNEEYEDRSSLDNYENPPQRIQLKNEAFLQPDESDEPHEPVEEPTYDNYNNHNDNYNDKYYSHQNDRYDKNYRSENYEKAVNYNENRNNYNDRKEVQKPIRIKQRRRRSNS